MSMQATLPKGVSLVQFGEALKEYKSVLGEERVMVDLERLAPYMKIKIPEDERLHQPSGALAAKTVEEVQKILAISNKYRIPLWTISTGRNFGYGTAAPATAGQMVLDLRDMNRILDVDPEMCTALVEPGVTFQQLHDYLEEKRIPLWLSFPSSGPIVGPVGNTLDRGMGWNRYAMQMNNFSGLEVVLADGDVLRTGMGGNPKSNSWQCYRWGYGPWTDGLFTQSNMGIVTKMGLWLMPAPDTHLSYHAGWKDVDGMIKGMDVARHLWLHNIIENGILGNNLYGVATSMRRQDIYTGLGAIPDAVLDTLFEKLGATPWSFYGTLYGTEEQVSTNLKLVKKAFESTGAFFYTKDQAGDKNPGLNHVGGNQTNKLNLNEFGLYNFRGGGGSSWFAPVVPVRGKEAAKSYYLSKAVYDEYGFDYLGGFMLAGRHADHIQLLVYDRTDPAEMKAAYSCFKKLIDVHAAEGYNVYRTNTAFMDLVADTYGPAQRSINKKLKRALDPNGILAPGKSGISI